MININVDGNNVDKALKQLRWKMKKSNILREVKDRRYFTKPANVRHKRKKRIKFLKRKKKEELNAR